MEGCKKTLWVAKTIEAVRLQTTKRFHNKGKGRRCQTQTHTNIGAKTIKVSIGKNATVTDLSIGDKAPNGTGKCPAVSKERTEE